MNQTAAKVPHEDAWQSIDIYLFSNGQQYSPPRKYHLNAEDLNWWDSTLYFLARTHYGSHKTIELYSLDGSKIQGPLDVKDGMTYVAVEPPDEFINSDYENYLIKASRSWEKRQANRPSKVNIPDEERQAMPKIDEPLMNIYIHSTELTTIKTSDDDNIDMESISINPQKHSLNINKSDYQQFRKSIINSDPRSDKKRLSKQRTSIMKTSSIPEQSQNNYNSKNKENFCKETLTKIPTKYVKIPVNESAIKTQKITKWPHKTTPSVTQSPPWMKSHLSQMPSTLLSPKSTLLSNKKDRNHVMDNSSIADPVLDQEKIAVSKNNHLKNKGTMLDQKISCNVIGTDQQVQTQTEQKTIKLNTSNEDLSFINSKIKVMPVTIHQQPKNISCNIPVDHNYLGVMNKGEAVNVNIRIELQSSKENDQNITSNYTDIRKASSLTNLLKMKSPSCSMQETITQTDLSLESIINEINNLCAKVITVQCRCCGNNTNIPRVDTMPVYKNDNVFFKLMPSFVQPENKRCVCNTNNDTSHDYKKIIAERFTRDLRQQNSNTLYPPVTQQVGIAMTIKDPIVSSNDKSQRIKQTVCINENSCIVENCRTQLLQKFGKGEIITPKSNLPESKCNIVDSYTQTEWCNILLEVRRHKDGRYSFHLPPLSVLKLSRITK